MTPREVIQSIRKKYFLDTDQAEELQNTFERVLKVLSNELYTKENHFVLELLQNADDNTYLDDVQPTIQLKWDEGKGIIEISNNEVGFTERNVRALCDIGNSTKKARREGYIGEKGIGFKSVFKVADRVYIASNGYSFVLDSTERLGMVAPKWVPEDEFPTNHGDGRTVFYLKLKPDINKEDLKQQFDNIHPYLLLFLRKIKKLELDIANKFRQFEKTDETEDGILYVNIKQIDHKLTTTQHRFLVHKHQLTKPSHIDDDKRSEVTQTKIVIAFPLDNVNGRRRMRAQNVFAFLPLRIRGFKFIIQADFLVTASREEVIEDNSWNNFLRDGIPDAFIAAVKQLKNSKQDPERQPAPISYLPLPIDIQNEFFQPVVTRLLERIRREDIILTCDMTWCIPAKAMYLPKAFMRAIPGEATSKPLIPNNKLKAILKMDYIHESYDWDEYEPILKALDCKPFAFANLVACLKSYNGPVPKIDMLWHRDVVDCLATHYRERRGASTELVSKATLKQLNIYIVEDGLGIRKTDLSDNCVFFFPPTGQLPTIPDRSMVILHRESFQSFSHEFLADLGVKELRVSAMAELVIDLYTKNEMGIILERTPQELLAHVDFLRRHLGDLTNNFRIRLRKDILLRTKDGNYRNPDQLYIPTESSSYDISKIFSSSKISPINNQYFEGDANMKQDWMIFLETHCGVHRAVPLQDGALPDWLVKQIKVQTDGRFGGSILAMFADFWSKVYEPIYQLSQRKFCDQLGDMLVRCEGDKVSKLKLTALRTPVLEGVFGDDRDYLELKGEGDVSKESDGADLDRWMFLKVFGVSVVPDVHEALKVLERMSRGGQRSKEKAEAIYKFLDVHFREARTKIKQSFAEKSLIIVKDDKKGTVAWRNSSQILWRGDRVLYPTWSFLEDSLPECGSFFVKKVGMKSATIKNLWEMVQKLDPNDSKSSDHMAYVYVQLTQWMQREDYDIGWLIDFCEKPVFLVKHRRKGSSFEKNRSSIKIVIDDDKRQLAESFKDLYILNVPQNMIPGMIDFLKFLDPPVQWMSDIKPKAIITEGLAEEDTAWTEMVRKCIPLCAKIIAFRDEIKMDQLVKKRLFRTAYKHLTVLRAKRILEVFEINKVEKKIETKLTVEHPKRGTSWIKIWMSKTYHDDIAKTLLVEPICNIFDFSDLNEVLHIVLDRNIPQNRISQHIKERGIPELPSKYDNIFDEQSGIHENSMPESNFIQEGSPLGESSQVQENNSLNVKSVYPISTKGILFNSEAQQEIDEPYRRNPQLLSGNMSYTAPTHNPPVLFEDYPPGIGVTAPNIGPSLYDAPNPVIPVSGWSFDVPRSLRDIAPTRNISFGSRVTEAIHTIDLPQSLEQFSVDDLQPPLDPSFDLPQQDPGLSRPRDEQDIQEVGYLGELFVFKQFSYDLPGFGLANWISPMRQRYLDESSNNTVGELNITLDPDLECDFVYNDVEGNLSRKLNLPVATIPRIFFLEVKTTTSRGNEPFSLTVREWESAERTSWFGREDDEEATSCVYVILRVEYVRSTTRRIVKELVDPWKICKCGGLTVNAGEWIVSRFM